MDEFIDISKSGEDMLIGFNPKFVLEALRVIDEESITIFMLDSKAPAFIKDEAGKYIYVILPINFNTI